MGARCTAMLATNGITVAAENTLVIAAMDISVKGCVMAVDVVGRHLNLNALRDASLSPLTPNVKKNNQ